MGGSSQLISRSCTTGWADWIHGELWLSPTALVRRRLSFNASRANGYGPSVSDPLPVVPAADLDRGRVLAEHRTNKVIAFGDVGSATLFRGRTAHGLKVVMVGGERHKLLWLVRDPAFAILSGALPAQLGSRVSFR
ncbi:hypothetical protein UO65_4887 [Actinokineospora spheciospongiae]|uniref:Uncharacterized protein n=1 Tax=Actinokineospora spheciospongiae TaxID=909613 RepID=W7J192_9PSEU|nr:hypothetical protein UO65_4887 [Actinokineospora spheciospongiae]PWW63085.1 hypothetical protein DFQ13_10475 [Actinokineospora spheciospongiae]